MYIINTHEDFPVVGFLHTKGWLQVLVHETDCKMAGNKVLLPILFSLNYLHGNGNQKDVLSLNLFYNWDNRWNILWIYCILENIRPSVGFFRSRVSRQILSELQCLSYVSLNIAFSGGIQDGAKLFKKIQVAKITLYWNWKKNID